MRRNRNIRLHGLTNTGFNVICKRETKYPTRAYCRAPAVRRAAEPELHTPQVWPSLGTTTAWGFARAEISQARQKGNSLLFWSGWELLLSPFTAPDQPCCISPNDAISYHRQEAVGFCLISNFWAFDSHSSPPPLFVNIHFKCLKSWFLFSWLCFLCLTPSGGSLTSDHFVHKETLNESQKEVFV